jgi:hypothetical protein
MAFSPLLRSGYFSPSAVRHSHLLLLHQADKRILIRISFWHQLSGVRAQFPADRVFRFSVFFLFSVPVPPVCG